MRSRNDSSRTAPVLHTIGHLTAWMSAAAFAALSCGESVGPETPLPNNSQPSDTTVASIAVTPAIDTLTAFGHTIQLSASASDAQGNTLSVESFTWVSSHPEVASVNTGGLVTAIANGRASITATTSGIQDSAVIVVATAPEVLWHLSTGTSHRCGAAIAGDGTLYTCSGDNHLYAINSDGTIAWRYDTGHRFQSSPAIGADGTIYVGTDGGELHAVNPDGSEKWVFVAQGSLTSPAVVDGGTVYFGIASTDSTFGNLYAVNSDGSEQWVFGESWLAAVIIPPAVASDGTVYVTAGGFGFEFSIFYAVNPDGTEKWTLQDQAYGSLLAVGADGVLYFAETARTRDVPSWTHFGTYLRTINPDDGSLMWMSEQFPSGPVNSTPVIAGDGTVYVASCGEWLNAFNPDGSVKWRSSIADDKEHGSPLNNACEDSNIALSANGTIFLAGASNLEVPGFPGSAFWRNRFFAFNPDGSMKWTLEVQQPSSAAIGADGTVYVGSADGVYAIVGGGGALAPAAPWPMFRRDLRNSGYSGSR